MRIHLSLKVQSLSASEQFYSSLFGTSVTKSRPDYRNFRLDEPPIHLALTEGQAERDPGVSHFGIELPDQETLEAWQSRTEEASLLPRPEVGASCCYAKGDKFWLTDPDGYRWEVWVRTGEYDSLAAGTGSSRGTVSANCCDLA